MDEIRYLPPPPDAPPFTLPELDLSDVRRKYLDIPYAETDNPAQTLDILLPGEGDGPFPTLIQFHVNYRLTGEAVFPLPVYDAKAAIRFLRANAETYRLDPARFAVSGDSAGAYFAALLGTSAGVGALEDLSMGSAEYDSSVQAVIGMFGVYDLVMQSVFTDDAPPMPGGMKMVNYADTFAGVVCREHPGIASMASPEPYITKNCPPMLIQGGTADQVVPYQASVELV